MASRDCDEVGGFQMTWADLQNTSWRQRFALGVLVTVLGQLAMELLAFNPSQDSIQQLQDTLNQQVVKNSLAANGQPASAENLDYFQGVLKRQPAEMDRILKLHQDAAKNNVRIRKSNYQKTLMPGGIMRTEMQSDVSGSYPAIRQYLRAVEANDPATAIDGISFSRPAAGAEVRAQIRFVLYAMSTPT